MVTPRRRRRSLRFVVVCRLGNDNSRCALRDPFGLLVSGDRLQVVVVRLEVPDTNATRYVWVHSW